jgi:hypothetical protein
MSTYYGIATKITDGRTLFLNSDSDPDCWTEEAEEGLVWETRDQIKMLYKGEFIIEITANDCGDMISWKKYEE